MSDVDCCCRFSSETDAGIAERQLRRLDPYFSMEEWKGDLASHLLPIVMKAWMSGDLPVLKQWLRGSCLSKIEADVLGRKTHSKYPGESLHVFHVFLGCTHFRSV